MLPLLALSSHMSSSAHLRATAISYNAQSNDAWHLECLYHIHGGSAGGQYFDDLPFHRLSPRSPPDVQSVWPLRLRLPPSLPTNKGFYTSQVALRCCHTQDENDIVWFRLDVYKRRHLICRRLHTSASGSATVGYSVAPSWTPNTGKALIDSGMMIS